MLSIGKDKQAILVMIPQGIFLRKLQAHLEETSLTIHKHSKIDFRSDEAMKRLLSEVNLLLHYGIVYEKDVVIAIECFELFCVDKNSDEVVQVLKRKISTKNKLDQLSKLRKVSC